MEKLWKIFEEKVTESNVINIPFTEVGLVIEADGKKIRNGVYVLDFEEHNITIGSKSYGGYIINDDYKPSEKEYEKLICAIEKRRYNTD